MDFDEDTLKRFWAKVDVRSPAECWNWKGSLVRGYGQGVRYGNGRRIRAHRMSLILVEGYRPRLMALHSCDNPACCNPSHLRWGTGSENVSDIFKRNLAYAARHRAFSSRNGSIQAKKMGIANRRLLPSQVDYIRKLVDAGFPQRAVAVWYCVTQMTISKIHRRLSYN